MLGIAALKLGAARAVGTDVDPLAVSLGGGDYAWGRGKAVIILHGYFYHIDL